MFFKHEVNEVHSKWVVLGRRTNENSPYLTITQSAPPQHVEGPISMANFAGKGLSFSGGASGCGGSALATSVLAAAVDGANFDSLLLLLTSRSESETQPDMHKTELQTSIKSKHKQGSKQMQRPKRKQMQRVSQQPKLICKKTEHQTSSKSKHEQGPKQTQGQTQ